MYVFLRYNSPKVLGEGVFWVLFVTSKYHLVLISDYGTVSLEVPEPKEYCIKHKETHWYCVSIFCKLIL